MTFLKLTKPGQVHAPDLIPTDPINRWKVEGLEKDVFIVGFNLGRPNQKPYWQIAGRKNNYESTEDALAVLQKEQDAG